MFVLGCPELLLAVDHKPLVSISNDKKLNQITNPRLLNFKERTLMYQFHTKHVPGSLHLAADVASRNPVNEAKTLLMTSIQDNHIIVDNKDIHVAMVHAIMAAELTSDYDAVTWEEVKKEAVKDDICMSLCNAIENGFPENKSQAPECMRKFYKLKDELYSMDGVPFLGIRMYIPATLRRRVLTILHATHQGVSGMKAASHNHFWWIGMDAAIDQTSTM